MSNGGMSDPGGVSIGQAAALYGLPPSTLRWWESQGVLPQPRRVNGRRVYTETDLRRLGLAYLCCVTGAMPLERAAVVTSDGLHPHWQSTVREQAGLIEEKIRRLRGAHEYLLHLLRCPDDDIVGQCPDLDGELMRHTPRGRVAPGATDADLVAAAQAVPRRDETGPPRDECAVCARPFAQPGRGRRRRYCSRACRQRRYRENAAR
jgi:MerR family transcriptional regulator, copper efflux regulator